MDFARLVLSLSRRRAAVLWQHVPKRGGPLLCEMHQHLSLQAISSSAGQDAMPH